MSGDRGVLSFGFRILIYAVIGNVVFDALLCYLADRKPGDVYCEAQVMPDAFEHPSFMIARSV